MTEAEPTLQALGADAEERELLAAARAYAPPAAMREHLLASLAVAGVAAAAGAGASGGAAAVGGALSKGAAAGASATVAATSAFAVISSKALLASVAFALTTGVVVAVVASRQSQPKRGAVEGGVASAPRAVRPSFATSVKEPPLGAAVVPSAGLVVSPRNAGGLAAPAALAPTASALAMPSTNALQPDGLADELALVQRARRESRSDATATQRSLDEYARRFPRGRMGMEVEVLRIELLAATGRGAEARSRARAFLASHGDNLLAQRVRRLAGQIEMRP